MSIHKTVRVRFTCAPEDIVYVNSIIDSYGSLGIMRTLDKGNYNCALYSTEGMYGTALRVIEALKAEGAGISDIRADITESVELE